ncbi:3-dehydroquinate synthase [Campylobacter sp. 19-13652]|uniref:3-dehydroquinate synthase n=1 Tax=Campylobacter sp. 19-13652 TaxID=2840180 RepID=UPI001C78FBE0|nr:3-dehydroquinate synthase [Campylobacter sp. 19-13652]BCX79184.1 3-dehydroquinate synthase [Campylobacter sp. 19-13652]
MKIPLNLKQNEINYEVFIDENENIKINGKCAIITNAKVAGLHLQTLLKRLSADEIYIISVPDGEEYKNLNTLETILEQLFVSRLDRSSTLLAFGGGVITDMTGFAASIYKRGIKFISVPTTLLAQVDASVGGKTGINSKFGKNLIGSFYQPNRVYCDSQWLSTLPKREMAAGIAEAIKMAVCFDEEFFAWCESADLRLKENLAHLVAKCVQIKARVVAADERESGIRAVLNYGHTFAHVIERESGYGTLLHGEAVAVGMVMANELAFRLGLISQSEKERIKALLKRHNLPVSYSVKDVLSFYDEFFMDKKSEGRNIKFILPHGIGDAVIRSDISEELVLSVLGEFK